MRTNAIKGRKQLRVYDVPVDVYEKEVYIYIGRTTEDCIHGVQTEFPNLNMDLNSTLGNIASAFTITSDKGHSAFVIFLSMEMVGDHDLLALAAHESVHASWHLLHKVGVELDAYNHEAHAYLTEFIFKHFKNALKHYIKNYKLKQEL